jgi:hypothetical protein
MAYVLIYKKTGELIKTYSTQKGARIGMRASNRNAGWTWCISRCSSGIVEYEWSQHEQSDVYDYAPYAIAQEFTWREWLAKRQAAHPNVVFG